MKWRDLLALFKETLSGWLAADAFTQAAALAYYTIFSLAPVLVISVSMAGLIFGHEAAEHQLTGQMMDLIGQDGADAVQAMLKAADKPATSLLASAVGFVTLLFGASGVFNQLHSAINAMWGVRQTKTGAWMYIKTRFLSFSMVVGVGFMLLASLVVSAGLAAASEYFMPGQTTKSLLWRSLEIVVSTGLIAVLFAMMFKVLPDAKLRWRDAAIGATLSAILFTIGKTLIGLYLGHAAVGNAFGAAGSLAVLLLWIFYAALIFFFGAEFTRVYAKSYGVKPVPKPGAVVEDDSKASTKPPGSEPAKGADEEKTPATFGDRAPAPAR